jgi:hypothetical protein
MKQLISDWVLAREPELRIQASHPYPTAAGLSSDENILSNKTKLLLLTHLYLELRLSLKDALRAAWADIMMAPKAQTHRLWVEQLR